ncbi:hypothetical protein [Thermomonas sp.]|uniref:hypothetical protein n=1 Tax=Thermomonas sp. TaxID=1971895 RepID=UPI00321FCC15|nr:hypothetical protein [Pseudomonadota bacterium]
MNIHDHTPARSHGRNADGIDAQRWQAQEAARRGDPAADAGDLRIASALRHAPPVDLPVDFAVQMAGLAHAQQQASSVLEQRLLRGLVLVFALSAAAVVAWYGRGWVAGLSVALPGGGDALGWCAAAALCLLCNWALGGLRRRGLPVG